MGGLVSHDPSEMSDDEIKAWGQKTYDSLPKCAKCGDLIVETPYYLPEYPDNGEFCSSNCADDEAAFIEESNRLYVIEHTSEYAWWNADMSEWALIQSKPSELPATT